MTYFRLSIWIYPAPSASVSRALPFPALALVRRPSNILRLHHPHSRPCRAHRRQQRRCDPLRRRDPVSPRQHRPQRREQLQSERLRPTPLAALPADQRRPHQRERRIPARHQVPLRLSLCPQVKCPRRRLRAHRRRERIRPRPVRPRAPRHRQRIFIVHLAKRRLRARLFDGRPQRADHRVHLPPRRRRRQRIEVHGRIF